MKEVGDVMKRQKERHSQEAIPKNEGPQGSQLGSWTCLGFLGGLEHLKWADWSRHSCRGLLTLPAGHEGGLPWSKYPQNGTTKCQHGDGQLHHPMAWSRCHLDSALSQ